MAVDYNAWLTTKYPYLSASDIDDIVAKAKMFYYGIVYKAYPTADETDYSIEVLRNETWIKACCDEIVERNGISSATGYKENGLSIDFDNAQISLALINMLTPVVGVIKNDSE
jgi:hypothetical protein